jgi:hypothetical protein
MTRRDAFALFGAVIAGIGGTLLLKPEDADAAKKNPPMPWHGYTQSQRNFYILVRGTADLNQFVRVECKPWLQRVVHDASGGIVTVPRTTNNGLGWEWESSQDCVRYFKTIRYVVQGDIIQMRWKTAKRQPPEYGGEYWIPHTAIVRSVSSTGMEWLDSNWYSKTAHNVVKSHPVIFKSLPRLLCSGVSAW